ncbi:MAG: hypothetical protein VKL59_25370 [Nostocaceae cyanobacterium]|nr:hypothetical protein [Nostocaceae cyanobacterium]
MLLERLTLVSEEEARILPEKAPRERQLNLQDPNTVMTELIRNLGYREFKTIDAAPSRWSMQGILVQAGTDKPYKMQAFVNIGGFDNIFIQVEIIRASAQPIILVNRKFNGLEALELIQKLPYFPRYEGMEAENEHSD